MPSLWSRTNAWLGVVSDPAQARALGGHGGMDFIMNYRLIQCMRDGAPPDMDVKHAPCTPHGTGTADFALFTLSRLSFCSRPLPCLLKQHQLEGEGGCTE